MAKVEQEAERDAKAAIEEIARDKAIQVSILIQFKILLNSKSIIEIQFN